MRSVDELYQDLHRYRLVDDGDLTALRARWSRPDRTDAHDPEHFLRWLALNHYVSPFVVRLLAAGRVDQLVLNQYRIQDQIAHGPMAGSYVGTDTKGRPAAIDVLDRGAVADAAALRDVVESVRRAMSVRHPNVARALDIGQAHGFHYVAYDYPHGTTLAEVLQRRGKLPPATAARIVAHALEGAQALHDRGVPGGELTPDWLLLAPAGGHAPGEFTVQILHPGLHRRLIDTAAIGRGTADAVVPDDLRLADSVSTPVAGPGRAAPAGDILRLGRLLYRCVAGREPPETGVLSADLAEMPELLATVIEHMTAPDVARRPRTAADAARALRVFAASEDPASSIGAEDRILRTSRHPDILPDRGPTRFFRRRRRRRDRAAPVAPGSFLDRVTALWEDYAPRDRDLVFFALGPLAFFIIVVLLNFVTGWTASNLLCLLGGAALALGVDRFIRWRRERSG